MMEEVAFMPTIQRHFWAFFHQLKSINNFFTQTPSSRNPRVLPNLLG